MGALEPGSTLKLKIIELNGNGYKDTGYFG
jgi:hypothetical protein